MKNKNPFKDLNKFELTLWISSLVIITISFLIPEKKEIFNLIASLIGVTALIFIAKGYVIGQVLIVIFAVFYGIISFFTQYYGEMITYLCLSAPTATAAVISWLKNPYKDTKEVKVNSLKPIQIVIMILIAIAVTIAFYFILGFFGTARLLLSTFSVFTSFVAASFTFMRSPYYGFCYAMNDLVLIVLWIFAAIKDISYIPMIFCFVMFLANDLYGFINWLRMRKRQDAN